MKARSSGMERQVAEEQFRRAIKLIVAAAILMTAGSLWYLSLSGPLTVTMVVATSAGVLLSVLLGCGLFAAAFFSANSGYDESVTATVRASNPASLPKGLESGRRTDVFTEETVPAALLKDHDTKAGTWGLIHVEAGMLRYRITDPRRPPFETVLTPATAPGIVEPTILHHVEPIGAVRFHVQFWRAPATA